MLGKCNITKSIFLMSHFNHLFDEFFFSVILFHLVFRISNLHHIFSTLFHASIWIRFGFVFLFYRSFWQFILKCVHCGNGLIPIHLLHLLCLNSNVSNVKAFENRIDKWAIFKVAWTNINFSISFRNELNFGWVFGQLVSIWYNHDWIRKWCEIKRHLPNKKSKT